jgi:ABC-2 type transport system permease protein
LIILLVAMLLRIPLHWSVTVVLGVLLVVVLGGVLCAGLSMLIASLVRTRERMMGIGQLITMPLFFSSNALYPTSIMPAWLKVIAYINPMSYLVDGLRGMLVVPGNRFGLDVAVLVGAGVLTWAVNTVLYPRLLAG